MLSSLALLIGLTSVMTNSNSLRPTNGSSENEGEAITSADPTAPQEKGTQLEAKDLAAAARVIGLSFDHDEIELMLPDVVDALGLMRELRNSDLGNQEPLALVFDPVLPGMKLRERLPRDETSRPAWQLVRKPTRPAELEELAFADIATLSTLIRDKQVSCVELTEMFLARLERLDSNLECVITMLPERAMAQAVQLDEELAEGRWRGPLHGIPWGAKDLLSVAGARTTWGAKPFRDQHIESDAAVVKKLDEAGAVLVAKLTLGALAWGDVWFGGKTRNPWNTEQGSSGSSAGSASAVAAGALPFAIGSETLGSIVSPSDRCGNTSLRPTFGRVARSGAMTLCWTLDKLGPICRSALDCSLVFEAIQGPDGEDASVKDLPFEAARTASVEGWRIGVPRGVFGSIDEGFGPLASVLDDLESLGVELVEIDMPEHPVGAMLIGLSVEAATAFDELTRSGRDDELVRQVQQAWPNVFRAARLVPAVEYLMAQRLRVRLMRSFDKTMGGLDAIVHPSFEAGILSMTNLSGHPTLVAPCSFRDNGTPRSISFTGHLYDEERLLTLARAWQDVSEHHQRHPELAQLK
ncbi:MAG: Asp-tRNA(Asn)/Glu-tRNA(Gln) amidotransferase A subunit family amidase [Planctomycetota bacterium]|jgi:Asp-tRNA(Asn)/Glu-tRNA(Gln) amidotransferase A subunit family amidase